MSLTAIGAPLMMTQLFGAFTAANAPVYFPGAPFLAASLLVLGSAVQLVRVVRTRGLSGASPAAAGTP